MKQIKISTFYPAMAWFVVVLVLMCLPPSDIPYSPWLEKIYFDKWVHMGVFGLLAMLFMLPIARSPISNKEKLQYFVYVAIATALWGLMTEFIQKYLVAGRTFDLVDWAADSLGAFTSFFICRKKYI